MARRKQSDDDDDSPEAAQRRRAEAQREREANKLALDRARRTVFTLLGLWKACTDKRCLRTRACRGDTDQCVRLRWYGLVPEALREHLLKSMKYMRDGMTAREASAAVERDVAHRKQLSAEFAARRAAQTEPVLAPELPPAPPRVSPAPRPGPRIRIL